MRTAWSGWVWCVFAIGAVVGLLTGCIDRELGVLTPKVSYGIDRTVTTTGITDVDLLLVIDNSGSMQQEQQKLAREIPRLVSALTSPPDRDGDGEADWNAVESLQVAVVTTDLGTSGQGVFDSRGTCADWGDDGALRGEIPSTTIGCTPGSVDPVQAWSTGDDPDAFAQRVGCVAQAGTDGCGFEQQLAAATRALGKDGRFPRREALLAIVLLSDEEDCSLADPAGFYAGVTGYAAPNEFCTKNPQYLRPVAELLETMRGGRSDEQIFFAAIAGIPLDMSGRTPAEILADGRMSYVYDGSPEALAPACTAPPEPGTTRPQVATPGRRLVELAGLLPGSYVHSICADDFSPAISNLAALIGARIGQVCVARELEPRDDGSVDCVVREILPLGATCESFVARTLHEVDREGRAICEVAQAPGGAGAGWYYDVTNAECPTLAFTPGAEPALGATLELQCLLEVGDPAAPDPLGG